MTDAEPTTTYSGIYYYALYHNSLIRELLLRLYDLYTIAQDTSPQEFGTWNYYTYQMIEEADYLVFVCLLYILATPHALETFRRSDTLFEGLRSIASTRHIQPADYTRYGLKQQLGLIFDYPSEFIILQSCPRTSQYLPGCV